jgi:Uma2 family endonuclease
MVLKNPPVTIGEFDQYILRPENINRNFELIAGEISEKMVSNPRSSSIGALMVGLLTAHVRPRGLGRVTGADGGYWVGGDRFIPDAAYISKARQPVQPSEAYNPLAPDLAVEVLSPSNDDDEMRIKIASYLAAGTLLWVIDPIKERVEVYQQGQPAHILSADDSLDGGDVLTEFSIPVKDIFAE